MNKSHLLKIARTLYEINNQNDMNNHSPSAPGSVWVTLGSLSDSSLGSHCGTVGLDFPSPHQRVQFESPNPQNTSSTQTLYFFSALTPFWRNSYDPTSESHFSSTPYILAGTATVKLHKMRLWSLIVRVCLSMRRVDEFDHAERVSTPSFVVFMRFWKIRSTII
jgi:hypothetical protein